MGRAHLLRIKRLDNPRNTKHGMHKTPTYTSWDAMKMRCYNPNKDSYPRYGGRGIKVHKRWRTFSNFLEDMGERPSQDYCLSRLDPNKDYGPGNAEWALKSENAADAARRLHAGEY